MMSLVAIARPAPLTISDLAFQRDVVEVVLRSLDFLLVLS